MEAPNAELLSQISTSSNHQVLWACDMSTLTEVTEELFPGNSKNKQIWQIMKTDLHIFCLWESSPFFFPVNFSFRFYAQPLVWAVSECADLHCWDVASGGGAGV